MASLLIRNLDEETEVRLREEATQKGHSLEEEAREILETALKCVPPNPSESWVETVVRRFQSVGGVELPELPREAVRQPPSFDK